VDRPDDDRLPEPFAAEPFVAALFADVPFADVLFAAVFFEVGPPRVDPPLAEEPRDAPPYADEVYFVGAERRVTRAFLAGSPDVWASRHWVWPPPIRRSYADACPPRSVRPAGGGRHSVCSDLMRLAACLASWEAGSSLTARLNAAIACLLAFAATAVSPPSAMICAECAR
jgi:hypothetical protein